MNHPTTIKTSYEDFKDDKKFKNLFDLGPEIDFNLYLSKTEIPYEPIDFNIRSVDIFYEDKIHEDFKDRSKSHLLFACKHLQKYNKSGICSLISLAPLFISRRDLYNFYREQSASSKFKFYAIAPLIMTLLKNMKSVVTKEVYDRVIRNLYFTGKDNSRGEYQCHGLNAQITIQILDCIGLRPLFFERERQTSRITLLEYSKYVNLSFPCYPILSYYDHLGAHVEVLHDITYPYFYKEFYTKLQSKDPKYKPPRLLNKKVDEMLLSKKRKYSIDTTHYNEYEPIGIKDCNITIDMILYEHQNDDGGIEYKTFVEKLLDEIEFKENSFMLLAATMNNKRINRKIKNINKRINNVQRGIRRRRRNQNVNNKNNKINKRINNKVNALTRNLRRLTLGDASIITSNRMPTLLPVKEYGIYRQQIYNYFQSLLNPELAVSGGLIPKQPSYISIPTSSVTFKEQINIQLSANSQFYCLWVPNFLSTKPSLDKHISTTDTKPYNYYSHFYYSLNKGSTWNLHTSFTPNISLSKYRLVSAKCSLQYNGSKIYQSGQFHSSAIYNDLPVFIGRNELNLENYGTFSNTNLKTLTGVDLSSLCDIELIKNGLWNKYINVTVNNKNLDNLAFPTDPTDHTFFPLTHYYSIEPKAPSSILDPDVLAAKSSDGGHLSYIYSVQNMTFPEEASANITFVIYYNYEIIADQSTAAFLRSKDTDKVTKIIIEKAKEKVNEALNEVNKNTNINQGTTNQIVKEIVNTVIGSVSRGKLGVKKPFLSPIEEASVL